MYERLTDQARSVLVFAQVEARQLGHGYIGTEHLLLSSCGLSKSDPAQAALIQFGVLSASVTQAIHELVGMGKLSSSAALNFTPFARRTLELAISESDKLAATLDPSTPGCLDVQPAHLLLGLFALRTEQGVPPIAIQVLMRLGVETDQLHSTIVQNLARQVA